MICVNCGKEIETRGFDWVHIKTTRYRCTDGPAPDPQRYAEPEWPEDEARRVFGACGGKCGEAPCIAWNEAHRKREADRG